MDGNTQFVIDKIEYHRKMDRYLKLIGAGKKSLDRTSNRQLKSYYNMLKQKITGSSQ